MNMYARVLLSLMVTALLPLLLVTFFTYRSSRKTLESMADNALETSALTVARSVATTIENAEKEMESWTRLETLQDVFTGEDIDLRIGQLLRDLQANSDFVEIWCLDASGQIIAANDYKRIGASVGDHEGIRVALEGDTYIAPVKNNGGLIAWDSPTVCMALPLLGAFDEETLIGAIVGFYDWTKIDERVSFQESIAPQEGMHLFLMNPEHHIVARGNAPATVVALLERELPSLHKDHEERTHALSSEPVDGSFQRVAMATLPPATPASAPGIAYTGVATAPERMVMQPMRKLAGFTVLACLAAIIGTLVLALVLSRRISKPITALSGTARRIADGHLDLAPPPLSGGELGQLAADLDTMRKSLKAQIETLDSSVRVRTQQLEATVNQLKEEIQKKEKAQREASVREQQLRQADKMVSLGILVSGVAHEINNPNGLIGLNLALLSESWEKALPVLDAYFEEHGDFSLGVMNFSELRNQMPVILADTTASSERIKAIVDDLKGFSRTSDERLDEPVDLNHTVRAALNLTATHLKKATHNLVETLDPDLPLVHGNERRLEQVVINLLLNAGDALQSCDGKIHITTRAENGRAMVEITDTGQGIAAADLTRITDPFFTTRRNAGGTGLGLSISAGIIEEHGGALEFESQAGQGTTARIVLPLPPQGDCP